MNHNLDNTADTTLWNKDLAPTIESQRTWTSLNIASLWVGLVVCVPAYLLASGLMAQGMSWWQAIVTVLTGNLVILFPMILIGHAGAKYGVPFPVLLRASFGTVGARLPAVLRGLVACGWFGIQTWVGGAAIYQILNSITGGAFASDILPVLDINIAQLICFLVFWTIQIYFIAKGMESIRWLETYAAPLLLGTALIMLIWAMSNGGGISALQEQKSAFGVGGEREGEFWMVFWPSLTAMIGFWSTLTLNIPDFTRFARSQRDQMLGQALGLPIPMGFLAMVSVMVTTATISVFGAAIWDPVEIAGRLGGSAALFGLVMLVIATLTTNLAANVVAPANSFSNLSPKHISFKMGGYITAGIGIAIMPWKLLASAGDYLFVWLVGYSSLLGPIAGILIVDYYFIKRCKLRVDELYSSNGRYSFTAGWNMRAVAALLLSLAPTLPGFLNAIGVIPEVPQIFNSMYNVAWFIGAFVAGLAYYLLSKILPT